MSSAVSVSPNRNVHSARAAGGKDVLGGKDILQMPGAHRGLEGKVTAGSTTGP